jgi:hypothetical protein
MSRSMTHLDDEFGSGVYERRVFIHEDQLEIKGATLEIIQGSPLFPSECSHRAFRFCLRERKADLHSQINRRRFTVQNRGFVFSF